MPGKMQRRQALVEKAAELASEPQPIFNTDDDLIHGLQHGRRFEGSKSQAARWCFAKKIMLLKLLIWWRGPCVPVISVSAALLISLFRGPFRLARKSLAFDHATMATADPQGTLNIHRVVFIL